MLQYLQALLVTLHTQWMRVQHITYLRALLVTLHTEWMRVQHITYLRALLLLLVCVSFTIIGQPRNSVLIRRV